MHDPVLNNAMEEWEEFSDDPKVREEYMARRKAILDEMAAIKKARLEGKLEVAQNLLRAGMDIAEVSKATGISEEEIRNLK